MTPTQRINNLFLPRRKMFCFTVTAGFLAGMLTYVALSSTLNSLHNQLLKEGRSQAFSSMISTVLPILAITICVCAIILVVMKLFNNQELITRDQNIILRNQEFITRDQNTILRNQELIARDQNAILENQKFITTKLKDCNRSEIDITGAQVGSSTA